MSVEYATDPAVLQLQRTPERGRATTEADLVRAYSGTPAARTVRKPCACRGWIEADPWAPAPGVSEHQATALHQVWRERRERA